MVEVGTRGPEAKATGLSFWFDAAERGASGGTKLIDRFARGDTMVILLVR